MNLHRDIALSAAALLLPTGVMMGTALALLRPALPTHLVERLPAKEFTDRFAAFAVLPQPVEPDEPLPPVPLPPVRPPPEPAPEPPPAPWAPGEAVTRSPDQVVGPKLRMVAGDICTRYHGWRVETGRSWHCKFARR